MVDALVKAGLKAGEIGLDCGRFIDFLMDALTDCTVVFSFVDAFVLIFVVRSGVFGRTVAVVRGD